MYCIRKIKENTTSAALIIIFLLVVTIPVMIMINTHLVYGQPNQSNFNVTDSINIQNIPAKKVHVGDMDIAYKILGKGMPPDPCVKDPTAEGCEAPVCSCPAGEGKDCPDLDCDPCIEDPSLPECKQLPPPPDGDCHPSYTDMCIPSPPPNLNCDDISFRNFKVIGSDPHGFDVDKDGIGCEGSDRGGDGSNGDSDGDNDGSSISANECQGQADCFRGTVTEIIDGDTIDINNVRVRLTLVNTPERGEAGYTEATDLVESACGVGTKALVDEDDGQKEGSFGRLIGLVYCGDDGIDNKKSLNEILLEGGHAVIYQDFCNVSEFSSASWVQTHGC